MEGINMLGSLALLDESGVVKPDKAYPLKEGENTIGRGADCNLRLKNKNPSLMEVHCVVRVSKNGAAISINKSEGEPVRINGKLALKTQILKHGDTLLIVDKKFQYLNEHLKDKPEDFFTKEKLTLIPLRKSVHPLSKTPATSSYKSKVTSTPLRNLNLSLRATPGKPSGIPKLNQTLNKRVTRKNFNSKTPNYYKTLNSGKSQKTLTPNTPNLGNEQDLISFSPLAQPLMHSPLSIDHEDKVENQPSCTSPTESPVNTTRQSKLQESDDSDIGEEEENQSGLDIVEESDEELEKPDEGQPKYITVRPKRSVPDAKINDDSDLNENLQNSCKYDSPRKSTRTASVREFEAFFSRSRNSSVININSSFMAHEEKNMATNEELSEVPFPVYDINEVDNVLLQEEESMATNRELSEVLLYDSDEDDDEIIPGTQQAKEASCLKSRDPSVVNIDESFTLHKEKSVTTNEEPSEVPSLLYDINEDDDVINKIKPITINESTEVVNISASESRDTENSKLKLFEDSTQDAINTSKPWANTQNHSAKRISTFDESTQDAVNVSASEPKSKRMSTFDESTQDAVHLSASEPKPKRMSTFDESTEVAVNLSVSEPIPRRMSTFDESTQVVDKSKNKTQDGESTKEILQNVGDESAINILDKTEYLSPVKPLRKSVRVQASAVDISNNTALHGSMNQTVKRQLSNSSMTDTSLNPSNASAKSVSCQSFSSFKHNKPETSKAAKLEETEIIDVVNISSVDLVPSDVATTSESRASLSERRLSNRTSQMFVDVTCTSTPFQTQSTARQSNKGESSPGVCSTNTSRTSRVTKTQRSSRMSVSKKDNEAEHNSNTSKSIINRSKSLGTPKNTTSRSSRRSSNVTEPKTPLNTSKKLTVQETPYNDSPTSKRSHSHSNIVEDSNMSVFRTPILHKKSSIGEKPDTVVDETPKSHLTLTRRSSKSTYNPEVEDITPVTPERLSVSGFSDNFKMPITTPVLLHRASVKRQSTDVEEAKSDMTSKNINKPQREMRQQRSPVNRLSNFEGVKKLMKTPPNSPKNDLRNIPNLRRIMSPKQQKSPVNDLSNLKGVKNLLKTPKQQKHPINDLSDVSGIAQIFNVSDVEVLHQGSDIENSEDLFTQLTGQQPRRSYRKCNSLSMHKEELDLNSRKTMGDKPHSSPRVLEWVEKSSAVEVELFKDDDDVLDAEPIQKSISDHSLSAKKGTQTDIRLKNEESTDLSSEPQNSSYVPEFDDTTDEVASSKKSEDFTDEVVDLQNDSVRSDDTKSDLQKSNESNLESSEDELEFQDSDDLESLQNSDDELSLESSEDEIKLDNRDDSIFDSSSDDDVFVNEISEKQTRQTEANMSDSIPDENLFNYMSNQPVRKSRSGRSLSPRKVAPQQKKSRKSAYFSGATAVPDVEAWKQERNKQINIEKPETSLEATKIRKSSIAIKVENDYDSNLFKNMSKQPVRKSKSGRSLSPKKVTPQQKKSRKSEFKFSGATTLPDVEAWKQEQNEQINEEEPTNPPQGTKRKRSLIAEVVENDYDSNLFKNMSEQPVRKSKSGRSLSPKKTATQQMKGRKSVYNFSATTTVPDVEAWKRERNEQLNREEPKNPLKGTKRKSSLITEEALPDKKRNRVAFDLPDEESSPEVAKKKQVTRSGRVVKETPKLQAVKKGRRGKGKDAPAAKEVSDNIDQEDNRPEDNLRSEENTEKEKSARTRNRKKNTIEIDNELAEVNPVKTRGRKGNVSKATKSTKSEVEMEAEQEAVVYIPPRKTRRKNIRKATVDLPESKPNEILESPPKTRAAKETSTDAATASTSMPKPTGKAKNVVEATADDASASTPRQKGRRAKSVAEATGVTDVAPASTPKTKGRKAKNVAEALTVNDSASTSKPTTRGRKAKNVAEPLAATGSPSTSTPTARARRAKNVTEVAAVTASASSPKPTGRKRNNDSETTSSARVLVVKLSNFKITSAAIKATRADSQSKNIEETSDLPRKKRGGKAEAKVINEQEQTIVSPPKTRTRNAKVKVETPQKEETENKQARPKLRGRRAKNLAEVESSTSSASKQNQEKVDSLPKPRGLRARKLTEETTDAEEEKDIKQALPKPRGRRAKNVIEETADVDNSTSSKGRKAKNVTESNKTGRTTRAAAKAKKNNNEDEETPAPQKKRTRK